MSPKLRKLDEYRYELPMEGAMRVPGRIYASEAILEGLEREGALKQVANVACLPGIVSRSMAMPDIHWGYGFPIGGVAAFDAQEGVVSPGGVGYDINCGVRVAATSLDHKSMGPHLEKLVEALFRSLPSGVGSTGSVRLDRKEQKKVLEKGAQWAVEQGMGEPSDVENTEEQGCMRQADADALSDRAMERGLRQLGTLGSGNHFMEIDVVTDIYDEKAARVFGLHEGQVCVALHSGSRGLGYQVCDDSISVMKKEVAKMGLDLPDRQLVCARLDSPAGRRYFAAMAAAANYAWANRQVMLHHVRETFMRTLGMSPRDLGMRLVYDVCHNIAKMEEHVVDGRTRLLCVHRKGATRAFGPGRPEVPGKYRQVGQPVLVPGDMGTESYILHGTDKAMAETFGSSCHGAGRVLSRTAAKKRSKGRRIDQELLDKGIFVRWTGRSTLAEEMPEAYKRVSEVVEVVAGAGIANKVARVVPVAVVKG
ncbi:MAG: RtcB family protein [Desulfatibacillaceae bacterium]